MRKGKQWALQYILVYPPCLTGPETYKKKKTKKKDMGTAEQY